MKDVAIAWDDVALEGVISFDPDVNDLTSDEGLTTAVIVSLFTDARAHDDDVLPDVVSPDDFPDRRGCWMDETSERENDSIGSRLWLTERSTITPELLVQIRQYAEEALQWMVDENIASSVSAVVEQDMNQVHFQVSIVRMAGETVTYNFDSLWEAMT